ncbi:MAG TPA: IPT/TIG domain-containing protein, partial [Pyrinomonadaceae bacterium]|nr:IPT/TIG domain-containing protein [Pyrinomonadaceae bacterium]
DMTVAGAYPIIVFNPTPGGGSSTPTPITTFYVMPTCNPPAGQNFPGITLFNTVKNQMWYNDGLWWGAFSDNLSGVYFYKQSGSLFTKGTLLDSNYNGRPDVLWNGNNLFVLVYEFNTLARLYKYTYNSVTDTYTLITGFPINLPLTGIGPGISDAQIGSITIAEDSTGKLWAAYPGTFTGGDGNYRVIWSTSADHKTWDTTGFIFASGGSTVTQEVAPIVHFGGNKVGIIYSNQPSVKIGFRYHNDGDPENVWSTEEIVNSGLGHLGVGGVADNHMSLRSAPDGRVFVVAKDSDGAGFINLYIRGAAGGWSPPVLVDVDPHAAVTRPTMALDLEQSQVYVFYSDATSNFMYMNKANMTNPVFAPACPYVSHPAVWDATTTRQNVKASTGLWAVGSTGAATSAIFYNPITITAGSGNVPVVSNILPATAGLDSGSLTLTVNGSNFANNAIVYFNGWDRATTFVSSTQLTAKLMASDLQALGAFSVKVMNPKGGTSAANINLTVTANISSLSPSSATAGGPAFTLTVNGSGFVSGAVVRFNGLDRTTTFVNSSQLTAQILASDILTAGTVPVVVVNPGGAVSQASTFTINRPAPVLNTISPSGAIVGGSAFTLTVNGANFTSDSVVSFNGLPRATTFVSATQMTVQILATDIVATGTFPITVFTPAPGGGTSNAAAFAVDNPLPAITGLAPTTATVGGSAFTLTVNGSGFISGSVVRFNGLDRTTAFISPTQLTAQITAADIQSIGAFPITVFNPAPGGGSSNSADLAVNNPAPVLSTIGPVSTTAGDPAFTITVNGTGFINGSSVRFNGINRTTTFVSSTQLTAQIQASDVQTPGTFPITVFTPAPGGGTSNAIDFTVNNPSPTLTSISPTNKTSGDAAFVMTVTGTNFVNGSVVRFNGSDRTTTFVSSTQLTAQITAADVSAGGLFPIRVFNPTPGGGLSSSIDLNVAFSNPFPNVSTMNPTSKMAGDAGFTLTITGSGFVPVSEVRCNGQARSTSYVSPTQLTAQIPSSDIATAGTLNMTVFNPTPGGGTSSALAFTVNANPRTLSVLNASGGGGGTITVPIQLTAQGDENALGFSISYDPALLSNPVASLGANASGATLNTNSSQLASGRYGMALSLPTGQNFATGTRQIVVINFTSAAVASQTVTQVAFGDQPVVREISNSSAEVLSTGYTPGTVTLTLGYEADVAPRPNGSNNGTVSIADWVQSGRFSSGLDVANLGSEFQRADCAPKSSLGNGSITISDWVQAGRYASGLDAVVAAGGPTGPATPTENSKSSTSTIESAALPSTTVRLMGADVATGEQRQVSIEIDTEGNENALGFSLMFDPEKLSFISAQQSVELSSATLNVN